MQESIGLGATGGDDSPQVFGREAELEVLDRFLDDVSSKAAGLLIEGEAGIGKTTLWLAAVRAARERGYRVLEARPAQSEARLSYVALTDLVGGVVAGARDLLPPPQERALAVVALQADADRSVDERTTSTAVLTLLTALAESGPVLVAVDDVQWLDPPSERALAFALRRCPPGVGALLARRTEGSEGPAGLAQAYPPDRLERLSPGSLSLGALHHLIATDLGEAPMRPVLNRIAAATGGNPFFALEVARALAADEQERTLADPLPMPRSLQDVVTTRVGRLSNDARQVVVAVSALSRPTVATVVAALGGELDARAGLAEAEEAQVLESAQGRVRFTHPLLASTLYASLTDEARRSLHGRLAAAVADPEERARHLAQSATEPDELIAADLERAAAASAKRGVQDASAELFEQAWRLTPPEHTEDIARRLLGQAAALFEGDAIGARALADRATELAENPSIRARALALAASIDWVRGDAETAIARLEEGLLVPGLDRELRGRLTAQLARFSVLEDPLRAAELASAAAELLEEEPSGQALAGALVDRFMATVVVGEGADTGLLTRALELESLAASEKPPHPIPMVWFHFTDAFDAARERYAAEEDWARQHGWEGTRLDRLGHLGMAELYAGRWDLAERYIDESCATLTPAAAHGTASMRFAWRSHVDARRGRRERARSTVLELIDQFERRGQFWWCAMSWSTLAFVEFAGGDYPAADAAVVRMRALTEPRGLKEVLLDRSEPFHVEALCALGELDRAGEVLARLEWRDRTLPRPWTSTALPRARAQLLAAQGEVEAAMVAIDELDLELALQLPFDLAWTQLVRGQLLRRVKQKQAAAEILREALSTFQRLGAADWSARARDELARVGLRHRSGNELTKSEQRIAVLAASGLTNREVAAAAFLSTKTVEAHLGRVYRKLGIRSRAELGALMGEGRGAEQPKL